VFIGVTTKVIDIRGRNWELLRQQAEAGGSILSRWRCRMVGDSRFTLMAPADIEGRAKQRFDGRFLNIANP
jgi:hypothetical protein